MGTSQSPVVSNLYMMHFEKLALDVAKCRPTWWLLYVDDTFIVLDRWSAYAKRILQSHQWFKVINTVHYAN